MMSKYIKLLMHFIDPKLTEPQGAPIKADLSDANSTSENGRLKLVTYNMSYLNGC